VASHSRKSGPTQPTAAAWSGRPCPVHWQGVEKAAEDWRERIPKGYVTVMNRETTSARNADSRHAQREISSFSLPPAVGLVDALTIASSVPLPKALLSPHLQ